MKRLMVVLTVSVVCGWAQSRGGKAPAKSVAKAPPAAVQPEKWPIGSIAVEGNHAYTAAQVILVAGLKVGDLAGKAEFDAATERLTAYGAFETVGYKFAPAPKGEGYAAVFQVVESPSIFPVKFEDLGVPDAELEKVLLAHDPLFSITRLPASPILFDRYCAWIREYLTPRGLPGAVAVRVVAADGGLAVLFRPAKGPPSVAQVSFEGSHVLPQSALREAITGGGIGSIYTEENFRLVLNAAIVPLYEARGHLHVTFPKLRSEPVSDVKGVHVFVTVDEGEVYTLGNVEIAGPTPLDARQLLREGDFKTGDIANFDLVNAGMERIRKSVRHEGYLDATVTADRHLDDAKKTADVTFHINAGPQYTMGKLTLTGLELEGETEITRIWTLKEGKPFNPDYPDFFLKTVHDEGLFDHLGKTSAEVQVDKKNRTVAVTLKFSADAGLGGPTRHGRGGE